MSSTFDWKAAKGEAAAARRDNPYPTHEFAGSNSDRQSVGLPGHCEPCAQHGHVKAHPDLGCGDVGCTRGHGPEDETETCARCPEPAVGHMRITARPSVLVTPARVLADEDVCSAHTAAVAREADPGSLLPKGALTADAFRSAVVAAIGGVHIGDVEPDGGHLFPGDRERIADAVMAALGMAEGD